jgi:hypothetical protein
VLIFLIVYPPAAMDYKCATVSCGAQGTCNSAGQCVCNAGYSGTNCQQRSTAPTSCDRTTNVCPTGICNLACNHDKLAKGGTSKPSAIDQFKYWLGSMPAIGKRSSTNILRNGGLLSVDTMIAKSGVSSGMCGKMPVMSVMDMLKGDGSTGTSGWATSFTNPLVATVQRAIKLLPANQSDPGYYIVVAAASTAMPTEICPSPTAGCSMAVALRPCGSGGQSYMVAFDGKCRTWMHLTVSGKFGICAPAYGPASPKLL